MGSWSIAFQEGSKPYGFSDEIKCLKHVIVIFNLIKKISKKNEIKPFLLSTDQQKSRNPRIENPDAFSMWKTKLITNSIKYEKNVSYQNQILSIVHFEIRGIGFFETF